MAGAKITLNTVYDSKVDKNNFNCLITKGCSIFFFLSLYHNNKENIIKYSVIHNHLNVFHHQLKPLATVIPVFLVKQTQQSKLE